MFIYFLTWCMVIFVNPYDTPMYFTNFISPALIQILCVVSAYYYYQPNLLKDFW